MEHCADNAVELESFAGSEKEKNPAFKDYDGESEKGLSPWETSLQ